MVLARLIQWERSPSSYGTSIFDDFRDEIAPALRCVAPIEFKSVRCVRRAGHGYRDRYCWQHAKMLKGGV